VGEHLFKECLLILGLCYGLFAFFFGGVCEGTYWQKQATHYLLHLLEQSSTSKYCGYFVGWMLKDLLVLRR
jgi:hypothetical protein